MLSGRAPSHISWGKQARHQHPRIIENVFTAKGIEGGRNVNPTLYTAQPPLADPTRQSLCCRCSIKIKNAHNIIYLNDIARPSNKLSESLATFWDGSDSMFQLLYLLKGMNYDTQDIPNYDKFLVYCEC